MIGYRVHFVREEIIRDSDGARFAYKLYTDSDGAHFAIMEPLDPFYVDGIRYDHRQRLGVSVAERRLMIEFCRLAWC